MENTTWYCIYDYTTCKKLSEHSEKNEKTAPRILEKAKKLSKDKKHIVGFMKSDKMTEWGAILSWKLVNKFVNGKEVSFG